MSNLIMLIVLVIAMTVIMVAYNKTYGNLGLSIKLVYALVVGLLVISLVNQNSKEHFEISIKNDKQYNGNKELVDLQNFFQFIEYYQTMNMNVDTQQNFSFASYDRENESIMISDNIMKLLNIFQFIFNDDTISHSYYDTQSDIPYLYRKQDYNELIKKNKICNKFSFLSPGDCDNYCQGPNRYNEYQYPLPSVINVHNYYTLQDIKINLLILQMLLEQNNSNLLESIKKSIIMIVNTKIYKEYLKNYKFADKYKNLIYERGFLSLF